MKVTIDDVTIDEKKKEIKLLISVTTAKGVVLKKELPMTISIEEYSKERVLSAMREVGIKHYIEAQKPAKAEKKVIIQELKGLEHEFNESQISASELASTSIKTSPLPPPQEGPPKGVESATKENAERNNK